MLLPPVVLYLRAQTPIAVFLVQVVFVVRDWYPFAVLVSPPVLEKRASNPIAVLKYPVVFDLSAQLPMAMLRVPVVSELRAACQSERLPPVPISQTVILFRLKMRSRSLVVPMKSLAPMEFPESDQLFPPVAAAHLAFHDASEVRMSPFDAPPVSLMPVNVPVPTTSNFELGVIVPIPTRPIEVPLCPIPVP